MSFLTPLFLFGLLAAAIPLAIHLIRRDKPPKIVFSTLRFFQKTSRKQFLFQKVQQWLLLLLRTLAVVLVVFAFARPFFGQSLSGWTDLAPRSVVILLDTSMSMAYGDYLERARTEAEGVLADLNPGDEAALVLFDRKARSVHGPTTDLATLRQVLNDLNAPGFDSTRYFPVIRLADEMLAESRFEDRRIYLISDFQDTGMTDFDQNWKLKPGTDFIAANVGDEENRNLAVTGVKSPAYLREAQQEGELFVRLRTLGSIRQERAELALSIDGEEQWRQQIRLQDQSETVVEIPVDFPDPGSHIGKISVTDEDFRPDNDFFFTVDVLPKIPVLVVNGEASSNWFEDEGHWFGLAVSGNEQSPFSLTVVDEGAFSPQDLENKAVVALLNAGGLDSGQASAVEDFVREGGSLLIAPGDRVQAGSFNRRLADVSPATLVERSSLAANDYLLIAEVEDRHPALRPLEMDWTTRFQENWTLKPDEGSEVLMTFDNGSPALIEAPFGEGRSLIFASTLDLEWNNLPLQSMYLPFIHETLKYLAATPDKKAFYLVGEQLPLAEAMGRLLGPGGAALTMQEGDDSFTLSEPGIYTREGPEGSLYYAVNRASEESDFAAVSPAVLVDLVLNPETTPGQSAELRTELMKMELEKPQRLWWWLLLAVALLLLSEAVIANRTYR